MEFLLRDVFQTDPEAIVILDEALVVQDTNPTFLGWFNTYGGDWNQFVGHSLKDVFKLSNNSKIDLQLLAQGRFVELQGLIRFDRNRHSNPLFARLIPIRDPNTGEVRSYYMKLFLTRENSEEVIESAISDSWRLLEFIDGLARIPNVDEMLSLVSATMMQYFQPDGMLLYFAPSFFRNPKIIGYNLPKNFESQKDKLVKIFDRFPHLFQNYAGEEHFYSSRQDFSIPTDEPLWSLFPEAKTIFGGGFKVGNYQHGFVALFFKKEDHPFEIRQKIWLGVVSRVLVLTVSKLMYEKQFAITRQIREQSMDIVDLPVLEFALKDFKVIRANKVALNTFGKKIVKQKIGAVIDASSWLSVKESVESMVNGRDVISNYIPAEIKTVRGTMSVNLFVNYSPYHPDDPSGFLIIFPQNPVAHTLVGLHTHVSNYILGQFISSMLGALLDHVTALNLMSKNLGDELSKMRQHSSMDKLLSVMVVLDNRADKLQELISIMNSLKDFDTDSRRVDQLCVSLYRLLGLSPYLFQDQLRMNCADVVFVDINHERLFYYMFYMLHFFSVKLGVRFLADMSTNVRYIKRFDKKFVELRINVKGGTVSFYERVVKYLKRSISSTREVFNDYSVFGAFRLEIESVGGFVQTRLNRKSAEPNLTMSVFLPVVDHDEQYSIARESPSNDFLDMIRLDGNAVVAIPNEIISGEISDALRRYGMSVHIINSISPQFDELRLILKHEEIDILLLDDRFEEQLMRSVIDYVNMVHPQTRVLILGPTAEPGRIIRPNLNSHIPKPYSVRSLVRIIDRLMRGISSNGDG